MFNFFANPWTVDHQAPLSMGFSRQEYWSGLPFPSPGHLPEPGIEPSSPALPSDSLPSESPGNWVWLISLYKGKFGYIHSHRNNAMWMWMQRWGWCIYKPRNPQQPEERPGRGFLSFPRKSQALPRPWSQASSLQNRDNKFLFFKP